MLSMILFQVCNFKLERHAADANVLETEIDNNVAVSGGDVFLLAVFLNGSFRLDGIDNWVDNRVNWIDNGFIISVVICFIIIAISRCSAEIDTVRGNRALRTTLRFVCVAPVAVALCVLVSRDRQDGLALIQAVPAVALRGAVSSASKNLRIIVECHADGVVAPAINRFLMMSVAIIFATIKDGVIAVRDDRVNWVDRVDGSDIVARIIIDRVNRVNGVDIIAGFIIITARRGAAAAPPAIASLHTGQALSALRLF